MTDPAIIEAIARALSAYHSKSDEAWEDYADDARVILDLCPKIISLIAKKQNRASAVARMFANGSELTVKEIKLRASEEGAKVSAKEIYNAIGYLTRTGRIQRLSYGKYKGAAL